MPTSAEICQKFQFESDNYCFLSESYSSDLYGIHEYFKTAMK